MAKIGLTAAGLMLLLGTIKRDKLSPGDKTVFMSYNLNNLVSVAQCDAYLDEVGQELAKINEKLTDVQEQMANKDSLSGSIPGKLARIDTQLTEKSADLAAETDLRKKRSLENEINTLESKRNSLLNRQDILAGTGYIDLQFREAKNQGRIEVLTEFITALQARKAELQSPASAA
jgi:predicted  nucleic acid-binding Zn-ribbon protein